MNSDDLWHYNHAIDTARH